MSDWWHADPVSTAQPSQDWWAGDQVTGTHTAGEIATDVGKSGLTGLGKGGIGIAGMLGDAQQLGYKAGFEGANYIGKKLFGAPSIDRPEMVAPLPTSADIQKKVEEYTGQFHKPETLAGKGTETVASFVPAAAAGPGGVVRKLVTGALLPGVASETAGQLTEGTALEPWARAGGAVLGGGVGAALSRPASASASLRNQLPDFVTNAHIAKAEQLINYAQNRGITVTWPEALSRVTGRPVLLDTQRILESAPQSRGRMDEVTGRRPQQVETAARGEFDNLAPAPQPNATGPNLPPQVTPSAIGPAIGQAAENSINETRQGINRAAEPFYDQAKHVLLTPAEMAQARGVPGYHEAAAAVRADPHLNRHVAQLPDDSIGFNYEVKKYIDQQAQNARAPLAQNPSMQRAASMTQSASDLRGVITNTSHSQDLSTALALEEHGRRQFLEPLLQGPIGRIADKDITTRKAIDALFPSNPLPNSQAEITTAVGRVAKQNPTVASQLVRAHVESVFNEATQNLQGGPSQWGGAKFAAVLAGNPQQRANLQAAVEALPNGKARWDGFQNFLDVLEATGKRQAIGSKTAFNTEELKGLSSGVPAAEATKLLASPNKWLSVVHDKWSKWQLGSNLDQLAGILTDPRSGRLLSQISGMPSKSREAAVTAARIIANAEIAGNSPKAIAAPSD